MSTHQTEEKRGPGKPQFEPTEENRKTVKAMAGYGIPQEEIAAVIGCDPKTLRLHFREDLDTAATIANARVAQSLFNQATSGNVSAAIFWAKVRMGWTERVVNEHTGRDGGPIEHTDAARDAVASRLAGLASRGEEAGDT